MPHDGLRFDIKVARDGYIWWYIDALSDDGRHGLTVIAFIGSVFSPYYAWARRRGTADPSNHCALNVALYGPRAARWSMTERGAGRLRRDASALNIGPSTVAWTGDSVSLRIDEVCAPVPRRIRGRITLRPTALGSRCFSLDPAGRHRWTPFAPCAHVSVDLDEPALRWTGAAYLDSNAGDEPLEAAFRRWTWSRAGVADGTVVLYDVTRRGATAGRDQAASMALHFAADGRHEPVELPPVVRLPSTGWRIARTTRAEAGHTAHVVDTLEDAPFYSRSVLQTRLLGSNAAAIHESLDLDRFDSRWVQCLLPFRMPRKSF